MALRPPRPLHSTGPTPQLFRQHRRTPASGGAVGKLPRRARGRRASGQFGPPSAGPHRPRRTPSQNHRLGPGVAQLGGCHAVPLPQGWRRGDTQPNPHTSTTMSRLGYTRRSGGLTGTHEPSLGDHGRVLSSPSAECRYSPCGAIWLWSSRRNSGDPSAKGRLAIMTPQHCVVRAETSNTPYLTRSRCG